MDDEQLYTTIKAWHDKARIDYREAYMRLYISYNAWFSQITNTTNDRAAIIAMKKRFVIWGEYRNGQALHQLYPVAAKIADYTQHSQIIDVTVKDAYDWQSIIEYWYKVRCHLFHGSLVANSVDYDQHAKLAYESLNIFMTEITSRMAQSFTNRDMYEMQQISQLIILGAPDSDSLRERLSELQTKYIRSPDIWNVDMIKI
ncbi:MAG: hypothetical protein EOO17_02580 [Chloroflexi bacterium]|nr:MAG: hypothetical protein EOO17_02580 [Chloroflexota bacterium]